MPRNQRGRRARGGAVDPYQGRDPREIPAYPVPEAALYLRVLPGTLRSWTTDKVLPGGRRVPGLIHLAEPGVLAFWDLAEAYVLANIRRQHGVPLQRVRKALKYVRDAFDVPRPLLDVRFATDGVDLFLDRIAEEGALVNASQKGQLAIKEVLRTSLQRVDRDSHGLIQRLYPFASRPSEPRYAVIDARRAFGRMVIVGTRIPVSAVIERFEASDEIDLIASDYGLDRYLVEGAIRWGMRAEAKAA